MALEQFAKRVGTDYGGRGTFATIQQDMVEPDPLGTMLVYYYEDGTKAFVSTSMKDLIEQIRRAGKPVEVDRAALSTTIAMGNLQTDRLPVKGAKLAPPQTRVSVEGGRVVLASLRDQTIDSLSDEALRDRAIDEILANVSFAASRHERLIVEVTGGLDSRVVLAAAFHLGLRDRIDFMTMGKADSPDRVCSDRIAHAFDIDLVRRPYNEQPISVESFRDNGADFAGVRWLDDCSFQMDTPIPSIGVLTGSMGELWRNYYAEVQYYKSGRLNDWFDRPMSEEIARDIFPFYARRAAYLDDASPAREAFVEQLCAQPGSVGQRLFHQYNNFRNRIHYGSGTYQREEYFASYNPLYSVAGYELAQRKDTEWQLFGHLSFEIIDRLFPALNYFPLAEKEISPAYAGNARASKFLMAQKPMGGMKDRQPLDLVNRYNVKPQRANAVGAEFVDETIELGDGILDMGRMREILRGSEHDRNGLAKAISSSLLFLEMARG